MARITYLCGGINGLNDSDCKDWRAEADRLLDTGTLDPMRRDFRGKEAENVSAIVKGDLADIEAADFILVNATRPSWGTAMEIVYARLQGKTIVAFVGDACVSPWLRHHCTEITDSLERAAYWINRLEKTRWYTR